MAENSGYWSGKTADGSPGDAGPYDDDSFALLIYWLLREDSGVLDGLCTTESTPAAMTVDVSAGNAIIHGRWYQNDASKEMSISANASGNPRIDRIILRVSWAAQTVRLAVLEGTPAGSPVAPTLTQVDGTTWEISLAQVAVANGAASITDTNITRERNFVGADLPGTVKIWTSDAAPAGFALCDGTAVSRTTYNELFDTIGTAFGVGDGTTTFNLPDMRGRMPLGQDDMGGSSADRVTNAQADSLGGNAGAENHTLTEAELPDHNHTENILYPSANNLASPHQYVVAAGSTDSIIRSDTTQHNNVAASGGVGTLVTGSVGSDSAHNNMPPYLTMNYIIKL